MTNLFVTRCLIVIVMSESSKDHPPRIRVSARWRPMMSKMASGVSVSQSSDWISFLKISAMFSANFRFLAAVKNLGPPNLFK